MRCVVGSVAIVATVLGAGWSRAQASEPTTSSPAVAEEANPGLSAAATPFGGRFPDAVLKTHEGNNVRFYSDLLEGKIVLINFMYATCTER